MAAATAATATRRRLVFISTGGTIFQKVDPASGAMNIGVGLFDVLQPQWLQQLQAQQQQRLLQWQLRQQHAQQQGDEAAGLGPPGGLAGPAGTEQQSAAWPPGGGRGARASPPPVVLTGWSHVDLRARSGAELGFETVFAARDAVRQQLQAHRQERDQEQQAQTHGGAAAGQGDDGGSGEVVDGSGASGGDGATAGGCQAARCGVCFVLVTGTDTLEEFAFSLDVLMGLELAAAGCPLVVTGAMKPYDIEGYDGAANIQQAVQVALCPAAARWGVLVALNDAVQSARWAAKADSQLIGAFRSPQPGGAVAQVREGRVRFYYGSPDDTADDDGGGGLCVRDPRFAALTATDVAPWSRVGIWTTGVSGFVPQELLLHLPQLPPAGGAAGGGPGGLVGLVVAAPGTGSLSAALTEQLAAAAARLPVVLVSRCGVGANADDHYYRGSTAKYSRRGLLLEGFPHCNALQARVLLVLRLAAGLYPQYGGGGGGDAGAGGGAAYS